MDFENMSKEELIEYINNLNEEQSGKYGLVWDAEKVPEQVVVDCNKLIPVLKEEENKKIDNGGEDNILIEGDNFHSLSVLNYTHKESIDVIYIDPPYNTGNKDFMYNDSFVDVEDGYRHSKWLNFMSKRLKLARNLLKDDGIICISIDDNEQSQLKLLCDKIFGENNYINTISIKSKSSAGASGGGEDKKLKKNIEYVLIYAKNYYYTEIKTVYDYQELYPFVQMYKEEGISWKYNSVLVNEGKKEYIGSAYDGTGLEIKIYNRPDCVVQSINQFASENNISEEEVYNKYYKKIFRGTIPQSSIRTRVMEKLSEIKNKTNIISIEYVPKTGKNKNQIYEQFYSGEKLNLFAWLRDVCEEKDGKVYKKERPGTLWDMVGHMNNLTKEGNIKFDNGKKPIQLIKQIVSLHPNDNATVLDFFAGSGSTGHAVLDLNREDEGNRKFILCTNNENNICEEITYQRLLNVFNGYNNKPGLSGSLKYFKTDFVENNSTRDQIYFDLTEKCVPMLCVKESTFDLLEKTDSYVIYKDKNNINYTCIYFDIHQNHYNEFIEKIKLIENKKALYIFSLDNRVEEYELDGITNYKVEAIPQKIYDLYRKLVKLSKEN